MDAVRGIASVLHILHQCFSHIKQAREFKDEFAFYQLYLQMHLSRCAAVSRSITFHDLNCTGSFLPMNSIDSSSTASQKQESQEPTAAEILSSIQDALREAQREAAQIRAHCGTQALNIGFLGKGRVQAAKAIQRVKWTLYRRDSCNKFIEEISSLILHLERQVDRERLTLIDDTRFMYTTASWERVALQTLPH
ncbi:hypothetical protein V8C35DRAFT_314346 [Trichoderma chlorosporum]